MRGMEVKIRNVNNSFKEFDFDKKRDTETVLRLFIYLFSNWRSLDHIYMLVRKKLERESL